MRKDAMPKGIVMMRTQQTMPATAYPTAIQKPANTNQMMLRIVFMV